jgi:hypothetical protein
LIAFSQQDVWKLIPFKTLLLLHGGSGGHHSKAFSQLVLFLLALK